MVWCRAGTSRSCADVVTPLQRLTPPSSRRWASERGSGSTGCGLTSWALVRSERCPGTCRRMPLGTGLPSTAGWTSSPSPSRLPCRPDVPASVATTCGRGRNSRSAARRLPVASAPESGAPRGHWPERRKDCPFHNPFLGGVAVERLGQQPQLFPVPGRQVIEVGREPLRLPSHLGQRNAGVAAGSRALGRGFLTRPPDCGAQTGLPSRLHSRL